MTSLSLALNTIFLQKRPHMRSKYAICPKKLIAVAQFDTQNLVLFPLVAPCLMFLHTP